jgi:hypothetical protein
MERDVGTAPNREVDPDPVARNKDYEPFKAVPQMLGWISGQLKGNDLLVYTLGSSSLRLQALNDLLSRKSLDGAVVGRLLALLTHQSLRDGHAHVRSVPLALRQLAVS